MSTSDEPTNFAPRGTRHSSTSFSLWQPHIVEDKERGVNLMPLGFLHHQEEAEYFGKHVRELEPSLATAGA
jgi:hypothetical protein